MEGGTAVAGSDDTAGATDAAAPTNEASKVLEIVEVDESELAFDFDGASGDAAACASTDLPEVERSGLSELRPLAEEATAASQEDTKRWVSRRSILLRFLRTSHDRDVQHAIEQLKTTIKWRDECGVPGLWSNPEAIKEEIACRKLLMYSMHCDKAGRPMLFKRIGSWSPETLCTAINANRQALIRGHILMNERLACLATQSWLVQRREAESSGSAPAITPPMLVCVLDMQDLGFGLVTNGSTIFPLVQELFKIDGDYYPETTYRVFVVNAPMAFTALWAAVKYMVHPDTREKIFVLGVAESHPELLELCGADFLPKELGGSLVGVAPYTSKYDGSADPSIFKVQDESSAK